MMGKGMEGVLKMMGINPEDLKNQVDGAAEKFNAVINHFDNRFNIIESNQKIIIALLKSEVQNNDAGNNAITENYLPQPKD